MLRQTLLLSSIGALALMNLNQATATPGLVVAASAARLQGSAASSSPSYTRFDIESIRLMTRMP